MWPAASASRARRCTCGCVGTRPDGLDGLVDHSSKPLSCPHQMATELEARLMEMRRARPGWGPRASSSHARCRPRRARPMVVRSRPVRTPSAVRVIPDSSSSWMWARTSSTRDSRSYTDHRSAALTSSSSWRGPRLRRLLLDVPSPAGQASPRRRSLWSKVDGLHVATELVAFVGGESGEHTVAGRRASSPKSAACGAGHPRLRHRLHDDADAAGTVGSAGDRRAGGRRTQAAQASPAPPSDPRDEVTACTGFPHAVQEEIRPRVCRRSAPDTEWNHGPHHATCAVTALPALRQRDRRPRDRRGPAGAGDDVQRRWSDR